MKAVFSSERSIVTMKSSRGLFSALADGRFPEQANDLKLYKKIATMVATAPLPALPDQAPTWATAASLAREWELDALARRLDEEGHDWQTPRLVEAQSFLYLRST